MRADRLRLHRSDIRVERAPALKSSVEAVKPAVVAEVETTRASRGETDRVLIGMRSAAWRERGPVGACVNRSVDSNPAKYDGLAGRVGGIDRERLIKKR